MINFTSKPRYDLSDLIRLVHVLRAPGGCPWDGKQTNKSLLKNLLEETYEYVDAVETHDRDNMREELGDVLLQSVFQARVCESDTEDPFGIDEVADRLVNKLITRHPHVFAADDAGNSSDSSDAFDADSNDGGEAAQPESPEAVLALWEKMKQQEKHRKSVLEGISRVQGALPRAAKVVSRISKSPNADRLFAAFDEPAAADAQRDDVHPQAATIPLNGRRPMPTPMKSSPSCARPALTASISSPHCAIACVMSKKKSP